MKAKKVNEALGDILKGKTEAEVEEAMNKLDPGKLLIKAVEVCNIEWVREAIKRGANVNSGNGAAIRLAEIRKDLALGTGANIVIDDVHKWNEIIRVLKLYGA